MYIPYFIHFCYFYNHSYFFQAICQQFFSMLASGPQVQVPKVMYPTLGAHYRIVQDMIVLSPLNNLPSFPTIYAPPQAMFQFIANVFLLTLSNFFVINFISLLWKQLLFISQPNSFIYLCILVIGRNYLMSQNCRKTVFYVRIHSGVIVLLYYLRCTIYISKVK